MLLKLQGSTQGGVMFIINLLISYFVIYRSKNKSVAKVSTSPIQSKTKHFVPKTKRHNYKKIVRKTKWFAGKDNNFSNNVPQYSGEYQINIIPPDSTPYSFFSQIFTNNIFEHIKDETIRYAIQSGKENFKLTTNELKVFFALNISMTYIKYPNVRMYWSSLPGMRMDLIANNMTVNRFSEIKRFLHFANNESKPNSNDPSSDKYWKLRPILCMLHDSFHVAATPEENVAIDEMMVPFKGRSSQKQYLKSKPKKWGFKVWVMANSDGYVNCFELYQGASNTSIKLHYGPIGDTVIRLCHGLIGKNHKLFIMDNLFPSLPLLRHLRDQQILVLGT
uniref:PiggyBac transposable element-derived protein 2 n=1 Tax=Melanaphis sacchari TaxID=742174 RepID=A0A2H8TXQ0_9HEMI